MSAAIARAELDRVLRRRESEHEKWHRLFGDDCRQPGCPLRKGAAA